MTICYFCICLVVWNFRKWPKASNATRYMLLTTVGAACYHISTIRTLLAAWLGVANSYIPAVWSGMVEIMMSWLYESVLCVDMNLCYAFLGTLGVLNIYVRDVHADYLKLKSCTFLFCYSTFEIAIF